MSSQAELRDQKNETLAESFVSNTYKARATTMFIGFSLSIILFSLGYLLTQQELELKTGQQASQQESDISMDFKTAKFALKNTAPGIVLIICGTFIAITTIKKVTWVKTQWENPEKGIPGYTESKG